MGKPAATDRPRLTSLSHSFTLDFVICCPPGNAEPAMARMQSLMTRLGLEVNTAKTHIVRLPEESFDFLGYTIGVGGSERRDQKGSATRSHAAIGRWQRIQPPGLLVALR